MMSRTVAGCATLAAVLSPFYVGWRLRPRYSKDTAYHDSQVENQALPTSPLESFLHGLASRVVIASTTSLALFLLGARNEIDMVGLEKLHKHVLSREPGRALVTVCNHHSVLDDPGLMSLVVPLEARLNPALMRWSVCTEDICFDKGFPTLWFSLGKAVPILRGGSLYQKGLATLQERVARGDWAHIFSEGRCWQEGGRPGRDGEGRWCSATGRCGPPRTYLGPLKWGVGKVVANAPPAPSPPPTLLPFFHMGMADIAPQSPLNDVMGWDFVSGTLLSVAVGDPVPYTDLVEAYHRAAGVRCQGRSRRRRERAGAAGAASAASAAAATVVAATTTPLESSSYPAHIFTQEARGLRDEAAALEAALGAKGISRAVEEEREAAATAGSAASSRSSSRGGGGSGVYEESPSIISRHPHLKRTTPVPVDLVLEALAGGSSSTSSSISRKEQVQVEQSQPLEGGGVRIPARVLPSGVVVPAYNEPPLRVAPPDHEFLTPKEAWEEDEHRLRLYSAIASRVEEHMAALEKEVMARRKAKGWVEKRPMRV